ncbi:MAG: hypothetical protein KVP17_002379 [Porospora cf. gigantea B]|uniref:uncharacterized protein n=1 Tax=Porospora cf. gigantea B TaxID=2853592 RepID=UPI003571F354|nr:MAG: hypothetical protein KVP17_002379 [Porospora cf. gigantea B]
MHVLPDVSSLAIRVPCLTRHLLEKSRQLMDRARHGLISVTPCEGLNTVVWLKSGAECREAISSSLVDARKLWRSRAFLHWFVQEGWEPDDIEKAFGVLADYLDG